MFHAISRGVNGVRSARDLRKYVAASVTVRHPLRDTALECWRAGASVADLPDYRFFAPLGAKDVLRSRDFHKLAMRMMRPRLYWGDDYALEVLSTLLMRRIIVVRVGEHVTMAVKRPRVESGCPIVVMLQDEHYYAVSYRTKTDCC